jgi:probable F420-dependent oxidoreductase
MKFWQGISFAEPDQLVEIAKGAEEAGFEGVLVSEHLFVPDDYAAKYPYREGGQPDFTAETPFPDPFVAIGAMATATTRLRFATLIHILPLHHPIEVAKLAGTAAVMSNNRVLIGAGAGWMREEFDILGIDFKTRGRRFNECIDVVRKLWSGGMVEHHGEFFDFDRIQMSPAPTQQVPILIGGHSKVALKRAASLGDGWAGAGSTFEETGEILKELQRLREEHGRADQPFETIVPLQVPLDLDAAKTVADLGADGTVHFPFFYMLGPNSPLQAKLDLMKRFGDEVVKPINGG